MKSKIEEFIKRNAWRNSKLYQAGLVEGIDFVVCPETKARMLIIRNDYITKVLRMTVEEYDLKYPTVQKRCQAHKDNIKKGIHKVDPESGLTKYHLSQLKARQTLSQVDSNGVSGYKKKGQRTRATHMSRIDEFGRNGYRRQADARLTTILPNGLTVEQNAHIKQKETLIQNNKSGSGGASKISKITLWPLIQLLTENNIKFYFDKEEYGIKDPDSKKYYFWDLVIPSLNMAIEYQSAVWHANPSMPDDLWNAWKPPRGRVKTAVDVLEYDYTKAKALYKHRLFVTYYVWEETQDQDVRDLVCLLKTMNMKS